MTAGCYSRERALEVLSGTPDRAGLPAPTLAVGEYETIARLAYLYTGRWPQWPDHMATELHLEIYVHEHLFCRALSEKSWIAFRLSRDDLEDNVRLFHEIAHALLAEKFPDYNETDAWLLTRALAVPIKEFHARKARVLVDLARLPPWFIDAVIESYGRQQAA
jgi:hypothetical protein